MNEVPEPAEHAVDLSIVVVSYRTKELTLRCLASIASETSSLTCEVVVVDNASDDGTVEAVRARYADVRVCALSTNVGFARAVNLGVGLTRGQDVVLLNPDTVVLDRALERLVEFARAHPEYGVYGGRTLAPDGALDIASCWGRPTVWSILCFATGLSAVGSRAFDPESLSWWRRDTVREVGIVTGCLLLTPRAVWDRLGGMDPAFFMYGEDTDFSLRARAARYRPVITPAATITHALGASSSLRADRKVMVMRGRVTMIRKHWPRIGGLLVRFTMCGVALRALATRLRRRAPVLTSTVSPWASVWRLRREWRDGWPEPRPDELPNISWCACEDPIDP